MEAELSLSINDLGKHQAKSIASPAASWYNWRQGPVGQVPRSSLLQAGAGPTLGFIQLWMMRRLLSGSRRPGRHAGPLRQIGL